jgi:hypothetical protein
MTRLYTAEFEAAAITAAGGDWDLFELTPADDKPLEICGLFLATTSELKEAEEEWLRIRVIRGHTSSGSTPLTTPTPAPLNPGDAAAGFTVECNNSTIASGGTAVNLHSDAFNVRAGGQWGPLPEGFGWGCSQAQTLIVVRLMAAVADDVTMSGTVYVREY